MSATLFNRVFLFEIYISKSLLYYVTKSFKSGRVQDRMQKGTVLDIGANIGNHTLYYALECHANKIFSFEPVKEIFEMLKRNIVLNGIQEIVKPLNTAVGEKPGTGFHTPVNRYNSGGTGIVKKDNDSNALQDSQDSVQIICIDDMHIENVVFMKIDVEGFESSVIKGAIQTISRDKPDIVLEAWDETKHILEIIDVLSPLGYKWEKVSICDYLFYL